MSSNEPTATQGLLLFAVSMAQLAAVPFILHLAWSLHVAALVPGAPVPSYGTWVALYFAYGIAKLKRTTEGKSTRESVAADIGFSASRLVLTLIGCLVVWVLA